MPVASWFPTRDIRLAKRGLGYERFSSKGKLAYVRSKRLANVVTP